MSKKEILNTIDQIAKAVAATFGPSCETAVCDFDTCKIVTLENGHVTGRVLGGSIDPNIVQHLIRTHNDYQYIAYPSQSLINGKMLKCTTVVLTDDDDHPVACFTINVDVSAQTETNNLMESLLSNTLQEKKTVLPAIGDSTIDNPGSDSVLEYTRKVMDDVFLLFNSKVGKPLSLASKDDKIKVLRELDRQGVLQVRDIIPSVCQLLSVSQATLYNYLKEIRSANNEAAEN